MKYIATKFSISNLIFFLVISFFGLTANAYPVCQEIQIYSSGACPGGVAACTEGKMTTQKVCYEVPDPIPGPIPGGGPAAGTGEGGPGGGGSPLPPPPAPTCEQVKTQIALGQSACRVEAADWLDWKTEECSTGWSYNFNFSITVKEWLNIGVDPDYTSGSDVGCSTNVLAAKKDAKLARCDKRAADLNAIIGSCAQYN